MKVLDYLLDGLEAELALERELGVRLIEADRTLLEAPQLSAPRSAPVPSPRSSSPQPGSAASRPTPPPARKAIEEPSPAPALDFVFLHDRPLEPNGIEMMAKIVLALGKTAETAPILTAPPRPRAKIYVVLGGLALRKFFPSLRGVPGQFLRADDGSEVLVTYSPAYILRFKEITPAVQKMKEDMWRSLKSLQRRV